MELTIESIDRLLKSFDPTICITGLQNGCGPEHLGWLVPEIDTESCNVHDLTYSLMPIASEKWIADLWLVKKFKAKAKLGARLANFLLKNTNFSRKRYRQVQRLKPSELAVVRWNIISAMQREL